MLGYIRAVIVAASLLVATTGVSSATALAYGKWYKVCEAADCVVEIVMKSHVNFIIRIKANNPGAPLAVAAVPLETLMPFGVTWQIDGGQSIRVPFMICKNLCGAQLVINAAYLDSLRKGTTLHLGAQDRQNHALKYSVPLRGFAQVYDGPATTTFAEINAFFGPN